jgi:inorganic pyrophosphatase
MVVEVPMNTTAKMEVSTMHAFSPIMQDVLKSGQLRQYSSPIPWNYGMFPQTWENPHHETVVDGEALLGDGDPLDVIEIGGVPLEMGRVYRVKVLGVYAMIDEGELDWKVVAITECSPRFKEINDIGDMDGAELIRIRDWFRDYKIPAGKPPNRFAFEGLPRNKDFAIDVIAKMNDAFLKME